MGPGPVGFARHEATGRLGAQGSGGGRTDPRRRRNNAEEAAGVPGAQKKAEQRRGGRSVESDLCTGQTAGLTDWPIERIAQTVEPSDYASAFR